MLRALLVKNLDLLRNECDVVLLFSENKPVEVNFMMQGNTLTVFVEGHEPIRVRVPEQVQ